MIIMVSMFIVVNVNEFEIDCVVIVTDIAIVMGFVLFVFVIVCVTIEC